MKRVNVLVFPCGSEVGLEIHRSLAAISYINLFGASSVSDHGRFVYKNYYEGVPFVDSPEFISKFNSLAESLEIDYIFSAMDKVALKLSNEREKISAELLLPDENTVSICQDKLFTYQQFKDASFCPRYYTNIDEIKNYPVIVKPRQGYGAKGVVKIQNHNDLKNWIEKQTIPQVICEFLPGEEVTVDCFTDRNGGLRYVSCRSRSRVRNGISVNSTLRLNERRVQEIAEEMNDALNIKGAWFFQLKKNDCDEYKLLEIATRVAGTMGLQRAVGVNLPLLTVLDAMAYDIEIIPQSDMAEVDRALCNSFKLPFEFDELYIDFDDTLIVKNEVNTEVMQLLYQCVNRNVPIYLITKHDGDVLNTMKDYKISPELFENIYHVPIGKQKSGFITPSKNALFIDDSFAERGDVIEQHKIKAFGVESVETLLDLRR